MKTVNRYPFQVKLVFSQTLYSQSSASVTMGSLAAYLRLSCFEVDLRLLESRELQNIDVVLKNSLRGNIIIAKPNFKDFRSMLLLLEGLKRDGFVQRVFLCGPFAKLNAEGIMARLPWLDGIFIGQIESSATQLLSTMSEDLALWNFLAPGVISRNTATGLIEGYKPLANSISLSDLPFPARDIECKEDSLFVNIEASRGCLFSCSFCHIPAISDMPINALPLNIRDPVLVVDEIEKLNKEMGKTLFIFNDSCFWSTKKDDARVLLFCEEIARRKLDVRFYVYLKGEPFVGDEVLCRLVKAGLVRVFLGVENSVKSSLVTYRKKIRADLYEAVKVKLDLLGVNVHIGFITIEPHSSLDDILSNVEYLSRVGKLFRLGVILEPVRVIPGTSLHQQLIHEGLMSPKLNYDEITYGYRFVHEEVVHLLEGWKNMFEGHLKDITYKFEYHSTVGELLRVLAERLDQKFIGLLGSSYDIFNAKKLQGMNILLEYFRMSIEHAKLGQVHIVGNYEHNSRFIDEFIQVVEELAALYEGIVFIVKQNGGERAIREVYVG